MWVDQRRLLNTTEPFDWTELVEISMRVFGLLKLTSANQVHDVLDTVEDEIFDAVEACAIDSAEEAAFAEQLPGRMTLRLTTRRLDRVPAHVAEQLRRQPLRWRLDYVWALRDCLQTLR